MNPYNIIETCFLSLAHLLPLLDLTIPYAMMESKHFDTMLLSKHAFRAYLSALLYPKNTVRLNIDKYMRWR